MSRTPSRGTLAAVAVAVGLAWVVYQPSAPRPFDITDFSEFVPLLAGGDGVWDRTVALADHYRTEHGRLNVVSYLVLALKWTLLGPSPLAWQWLRFGQMLGLAAAAALLLVRLGVGVGPAMAGASLLLVSFPASDAWVRLTMGEALGLAGLLAAAHLVAGARGPGDAWRGMGAGLLMACAILAKETLAATVPLLVGLATARDASGAWRWPRLDGRALRLAGPVVLGAGVAAGAVLVAMRSAPPGAFITSYGSGIPVERLSLWLFRFVMPAYGRGWSTGLLEPGNAAFVILVVPGLLLHVRGTPPGASRWVPPGLATLLPLGGVLAYLPWPYLQRFYVVPFVLGSAWLLALAVRAVESSGLRLLRGATRLALAVLILAGAAEAQRDTAAQVARQRLHGAVLDALAAHRQPDSVLVAVSAMPQQAWQGRGPTLMRYAAAFGAPPPERPARDLPCREAGDRWRTPGAAAVLVTFSDGCGLLPAYDARVEAAYRAFAWERGRLVTERLVADLVMLPRAPGAP